MRGLGACADLLERWGGHRAAAGLSIKPENIPAFAERFAAHAAGLLEEEDLRTVTRVDGIVPRGTRLTLDLCAELAQLAPFGLGNPEVTLLAPGLRARRPRHRRRGQAPALPRAARRSPTRAARSRSGIGSRLDVYRQEGRWDVAFRLSENRWNGTVSPQLVVRRIFAADPRVEELREWLVGEYRKPEAARDAEATAIFAELGPGKRRTCSSRSASVRCSQARPCCARAA